MEIDGRPLDPRHPFDAMNAGIGMVPEDRKEAGSSLDEHRGEPGGREPDSVSHAGIISDRLITDLAEEYVKRLRIVTPTIEREVRLLSGGNQQKVLLGKWLARKPRLLIVDEPTRGVDVGSKADVYAILRELAKAGSAAARLLGHA